MGEMYLKSYGILLFELRTEITQNAEYCQLCNMLMYLTIPDATAGKVSNVSTRVYLGVEYY